jgi:hypothetical protein
VPFLRNLRLISYSSPLYSWHHENNGPARVSLAQAGPLHDA